MRVNNVHTRVLPCSLAAAGALLSQLSSPGDLLWPDEFEPMRFDRPLGVGARGGHGPIRYTVTAFEPGRRVEFTFGPRVGIRGKHAAEVESTTEGTLMRHTVEGSTTGKMIVLWPLLIRWLHDECVELMLDRAESNARGATVSHRSGLWAAFLLKRTPQRHLAANRRDRAARDRGELLHL